MWDAAIWKIFCFLRLSYCVMCEFVKMQCVVGSPLQSSAEFCLTQEMTRLEKKSSWLLSLHFPPKTTGGVSKVENNIFPSALKSQISQKLSHMSGYQTVSTEWILLQDVSIQNAVNMTLLYDFRAPKNYSFNFPKIIFIKWGPASLGTLLLVLVVVLGGGYFEGLWAKPWLHPK